MGWRPTILGATRSAAQDGWPARQAGYENCWRLTTVNGFSSHLFNFFHALCDLTDNTGHLPTDRHGHEASVDCELALLKLERELNPEIYQNVTNWIWFSPWWLAHTNNLWMLSNDTGEFAGLPEISSLVRAAAYRDVHLYKIFSDPQTRPLVPRRPGVARDRTPGRRRRRCSPEETCRQRC